MASSKLMHLDERDNLTVFAAGGDELILTLTNTTNVLATSLTHKIQPTPSDDHPEGAVFFLFSPQ